MGAKFRGSKRGAEKPVAETNGAKNAKKMKLSKKQEVEVSEEELSEEEESDESSVSGESDGAEVSDESEDELDQLDQAENAEDDEAEDIEDDKENEGQESSKAKHEEQKKLLAERKLKRKSGVEVENIKKLWEKLRVKNPPMPKALRDKLCDQIWELASDVIGDLVLKHDASRVVQTLVKYSSKQRREVITRELKGHFYNLATSSYGKYLLIKLLHYGSRESRELILSELHGKLRKLMRHREGAYVVEDLYVLYATAKQKQQMIKEFWGSEYAVFRDSAAEKDIKQTCSESTEKRKMIAHNLLTTIKASVEKGSTGFQILHAAMREYVQIFEGDEVREFIELLQEQIAELVHTPEGCEVACTLIAKATAKERKNILKGLKNHAEALATNEHGQFVLQIIFMTVDDTVLVGRTFTSTLGEKFDKLLAGKFSRRPFIYLLDGLDKSFFSPLVLKDIQKYMELSAETSKKPQDQRRQEILKSFLPVFYSTVTAKTGEILKENLGSQFVQELILNNEFADDVSESRSQVLENITELVSSDISEEDHLMAHPFTSRLLKTLIQGGKWNNAEKTVVKTPDVGLGYDYAVDFAEKLFNFGDNEDTLKSWIGHKQGSFVVVAILESFKEHSGEKDVKKFVKQVKKQEKFVKKQDADNKGAQLLLKVLN